MCSSTSLRRIVVDSVSISVDMVNLGGAAAPITCVAAAEESTWVPFHRPSTRQAAVWWRHTAGGSEE